MCFFCLFFLLKCFRWLPVHLFSLCSESSLILHESCHSQNYWPPYYLLLCFAIIFTIYYCVHLGVSLLWTFMSRNTPFFTSTVKMTFTYSNIIHIYNSFNYVSFALPYCHIFENKNQLLLSFESCDVLNATLWRQWALGKLCCKDRNKGSQVNWTLEQMELISQGGCSGAVALCNFSET